MVLAGGFNIRDGKVSFTVPKVIADKDWSVVCEWQYVQVLPPESDDIVDSVRRLWQLV